MTFRFLAFYIFGIVLFVRALTEPCPDGQFKPNYIDGCSDCPENPETNCEAEGDDSESCKTSCIIKDTSNKKTIVLGVTLGVVALIMIVIGLGLLRWHLKKKKNNESLNGPNPVEDDDEEVNSTDLRVRSVLNGNEDNHSNPPSSPGPESPIYRGPEIAFDLDIRKDDPSSSVYLSSSDITHN